MLLTGAETTRGQVRVETQQTGAGHAADTRGVQSVLQQGDTNDGATQMFGHDTLFLYFTRRAQQEQIAAINAGNTAAAAAHRTLSNLHAAKALLALADGRGHEEAAIEASRVTRLAAMA